MVSPEMAKFTEQLENVKVQCKQVAVFAFIFGFGLGVALGAALMELYAR